MAIKPIEILINAKDNASSVFSGLLGKLSAVGAAVAAYFGVNAFVGVVKGAADLESAMSRVQAATGASAAEMARLRTAAEDAGANTKYTSTEAAGALENLAKAGLSASDAIAALPAVMNLAQAGDIDLGRASEVVTAAVMGMGLAFTDAGRVADVLAMGANATKTSVDGLAQALSYAAPVAHSLGVSLESTTAIIGQFAQGGIDASRAGTALNAIMSQFSDPASKFRKELASAGITTSNFEEALHQLAAAGPAGSMAINAVGTEAGPALRAMLNQGMGALDSLTDKLKTAGGSAAATAKVMQDNLNGSLSGLSSAWDTLKNALGTPVLPILKDGVDQLAAAFKRAVEDGTIAKFGAAIATALQNGIQYIREFVGAVDFAAVIARLQDFADRTNETFTKIGTYASNAGNSVQLAYGVMSAGVNGVLVAIYGIGSVFAEVASTVMTGVGKLRDGLATVTFGALSKNFKLAADDARLMAEGFGAAAQDMRNASGKAMDSMASSAQTARNGFAGLAGALDSSKPAITAAAAAFDDMGKRLEETRQKSQQAQKATEDKRAADIAATAALQQLRTEYADLIASGNLQAAAQKLQEINKALAGTPPAAKDAAKAADEAAKAILEAFQTLGVTSSAVLKNQAADALRAYEIIKGAGTSTAADIASAWKAYAEKAIAANAGVATETIKSEAAMRGLEIQTDATGKAIVKTMGEGAVKSAELGSAIRLSTEQLRAQEDALDRIAMRYKLASDYTERQIALLEREAAAIEKAAEAERKRLSIDKQGFSVDASGNRISQQVENRTSVAGTLTGMGVSDAQAQAIAAQLVDAVGNINLKSSGVYQEGDVLSTVLQKLAARSAGASVTQASAPATTVNINLAGRAFAIKTDPQGSTDLQALLRELQSGQSVY